MGAAEDNNVGGKCGVGEKLGKLGVDSAWVGVEVMLDGISEPGAGEQGDVLVRFRVLCGELVDVFGGDSARGGKDEDVGSVSSGGELDGGFGADEL